MVQFVFEKRTFEFLFLAVRVGYQLPVDSQSAYAALPGKKNPIVKILFFQPVRCSQSGLATPQNGVPSRIGRIRFVTLFRRII